MQRFDSLQSLLIPVNKTFVHNKMMTTIVASIRLTFRVNFHLTRQYLTSLRLYQFARNLIKLIDKDDKLIVVCMCVWGAGV